MADFRDPQSDEEGFESALSLDDNIIGPLGEREGESDSSEDNASKGTSGGHGGRRGHRGRGWGARVQSERPGRQPSRQDAE